MGKIISVIAAIIVVAAGFVAANALFTVSETQQALVMQFGEVRDVIREPGLNVKTPFLQNVIFVDKRIMAVSTKREEVVARDQKRLKVDSFARFRISDPLLYFQSFGNIENAFSRVETILNSQTRQILGAERLNDIVSGERARLMNQIKQQVNTEMERRGIQVVDVRIVRADLPPENSAKVFDRMRTQRDQEAKEIRARGAEMAQRIRANSDKARTVIIAEAKRDSEIQRGVGDAEKNRIFADAFGKDEDFFTFYRSMQAYTASMGDEDTTMILSPDSDFFRYFNPNTAQPLK
jgi:membrane protease subunit HflC